MISFLAMFLVKNLFIRKVYDVYAYTGNFILGKIMPSRRLKLRYVPYSQFAGRHFQGRLRLV